MGRGVVQAQPRELQGALGMLNGGLDSLYFRLCSGPLHTGIYTQRITHYMTHAAVPTSAQFKSCQLC